MDFQTWLAFFAASCLIAVSPGSGAVLSMSHGLSYGVRKASATILGLAIGLAPKPQDDLKGLAACQLLHPDRYCRLTYAPSTIAP